MSWPGNWRQEWAQAVRRASDLSTTARLVGQALALDFANGSTGQCNPSRETLADHLCVSEATIKRALADLVNGGWLSKTTGTARNRTAQHTFLIPGKSRGEVVQFTGQRARNAGQKRPAIDDGTRVKSEPNAGQICATPYKGRNQVKNQSAREQGSTVASPVWQSALIEPGSHRESTWNAWLAEKGWPSVSELGVRHSDASGVGWRMPFAFPPNDSGSIQASITEKYLNWASARMIEQKDGRA
ncbi:MULTISPECIES: helix-turn-helix domain-containing protein [unclassified Roseovarius]|uniref:helix-turn-helix domain-containing protein n=1 Tax=unclassified Roseovarius TaxID=2614913 RepID=UPI00273DC7EB|nr:MULTISPECIES: helix-turn-helix domain-containing protein [unclassified Roseovarius]